MIIPTEFNSSYVCTSSSSSSPPPVHFQHQCLWSSWSASLAQGCWTVYLCPPFSDCSSMLTVGYPFLCGEFYLSWAILITISVRVDKHTIICSKLRATNHTKIWILLQSQEAAKSLSHDVDRTHEAYLFFRKKNQWHHYSICYKLVSITFISI